MKILVLAPQPFFVNRGTPIATLKLLRVLSLDGHDLDVVSFHEGVSVDVPRCRHYRIPRLPLIRNIKPGFSWKKVLCDFFLLFTALKLCQRNQYDVVHAVEESVFIAIVLKVLFGTPYVYDMDSSLVHQLQEQKPWLRCLRRPLAYCQGAAIRGSCGIVAVCQSLEAMALSYTDAVPIVRVEDSSLFSLESDDQADVAAEAEQELPPGPIVMYAGNLQHYQGIDLLLDAFVLVYHQHAAVQLVIVGGSAEDVEPYRARAKEVGIGDRVHFLGQRPVEQLGRYLRRADVLVSPRTKGDNTPMKVYSYLEAGRPVLATRLLTHTQILDDTIALLVPPNPLDFARGMMALLNDPLLRNELAGRGKAHLRAVYSPAELDGRLSEFYQELSGMLSTNAVMTFSESQVESV